MKDLIMTSIGITIGAFFLIAALNLGLAPTIGDKFNVTDSTFLSNVSALATNFTTHTLTGPDTGFTGLGTVTWQKFGSNYLNVTSRTGTLLAQVTTSPATFNITGSLLTSSLILNYTTNSSITGNAQASNISSVQVEYRQISKATQQTWDPASLILYRIILPLALIVAFIMFFMNG